MLVPFSSKKQREKREQMHDAAATFGAKTLVNCDLQGKKCKIIPLHSDSL